MIQLWQFLTRGIWQVRARDLSRKRSLGLRFLRVPVLALRGFQQDNCSMRSLSLTYYTLISLVPILALVLGIAKGFDFQKTFENQLFNWFKGQQELVDLVLGFANKMLESTHGGIIAGMGLMVLFWSAFRLFWNMEKAFNDIWGIRENRSIGGMITAYLAAGVICPLLFVLSTGLTVYIATKLQDFTVRVGVVEHISPFIYSMLNLLPYCVIWVLLSFIYVFLPNGKINMRSGILGGVVAGTLYLLFQWIYIGLQVGVVRLNAVYGSFAALPLLMMWVNISWHIVLLGGEIAHANQYASDFVMEPELRELSGRARKVLALCLMHRIAVRFDQRQPPETARRISDKLELPLGPVIDELDELVQAGALNRLQSGDAEDPAFQPALSVTDLTVAQLLSIVEKRGLAGPSDGGPPAWKEFSKTLEAFARVVETDDSNKRILDIAKPE